MSYSFGFTCQCVNAGCVCVIRILCLAKMSFMDETIGEFRVRMVSLAISVTTGFAVSITFFLAGESNAGSLFTIMTGQARPSGRLLFHFPVSIVWKDTFRRTEKLLSFPVLFRTWKIWKYVLKISQIVSSPKQGRAKIQLRWAWWRSSWRLIKVKRPWSLQPDQNYNLDQREHLGLTISALFCNEILNMYSIMN